MAVIVGAVDMKNELNASGCWTASVTLTCRVMAPKSTGNVTTGAFFRAIQVCRLSEVSCVTVVATVVVAPPGVDDRS